MHSSGVRANARSGGGEAGRRCRGVVLAKTASGVTVGSGVSVQRASVSTERVEDTVAFVESG